MRVMRTASIVAATAVLVIGTMLVLPALANAQGSSGAVSGGSGAGTAGGAGGWFGDGPSGPAGWDGFGTGTPDGGTSGGQPGFGPYGQSYQGYQYGYPGSPQGQLFSGYQPDAYGQLHGPQYPGGAVEPAQQPPVPAPGGQRALTAGDGQPRAGDCMWECTSSYTPTECRRYWCK
jgi:hypothetical protein